MTAERTPTAAIVALGVTQIIGYGTLYYAFSILAADIARDFDWSVEWVFGALSIALLAGGLLAPLLGAWIDRFGAGRLMTVGSVLASAGLVACALAPTRTAFVLALIAVEIAANLVQYGAAFALLVQIRPQVAQRSITYLTLIGGFASTIFWPITATLHAQMPWQHVYLAFAALNLVVCLPLHAWLARELTQSRMKTQSLSVPVRGRLEARTRRLGFVLLVTAFSLQSLVGAAILVHMVPLLSGLGLGASAAIVGTLFGPAQVLSRLTNMVFGGKLSPVVLALTAAGLMTLAIVTLVASAPAVAGAIAFAVLFGLGNGLFSIVSGTLPLMLFGSEGFGGLQGRVTAARLIVSATAPFALAYGMALFGTSLSLGFTATAGTLAIVGFAAIYALVPQETAAIGEE